MLAVAVLTGLLAGWLLCWASERTAAPAAPGWSADPASASATHAWAAQLLPGRKPGWRWAHLGVILANAFTFGYVWARFGLTWEALGLVACFGFLVIISLIDLKSRRVPNRLVYPAIVLALLYHGLASPRALAEAAVGGGLAFLVFYLTAWLRPGELGGGDIKLATLIGIGFGFPRVLWALLVGAGLGAGMALGLICLLRQNAKSRIPYAPYLCLGAWIALIYHPHALFWR